jgi:hypothetical protein
MAKPEYEVGDYVEHVAIDSTFLGEIRAVFRHKNGAWRYVLQNVDGILHLYSGRTLMMRQRRPADYVYVKTNPKAKPPLIVDEDIDI